MWENSSKLNNSSELVVRGSEHFFESGANIARVVDSALDGALKAEIALLDLEVLTFYVASRLDEQKMTHGGLGWAGMLRC